MVDVSVDFKKETKIFDNKLIISLQSYPASQSYLILLSYAMNHSYS